MKKPTLALAAAALLLALSGGVALAQDGERHDDQRGHMQFDDHDQQVTRDWYGKNREHAPAGLRTEDRLSTDEEARLHEGAVLDRHLRRKVHSAPRELTRLLPPPPHHHRYVTIGGHVGLIDSQYRVKSVIHLHDDHDHNQ